MMLNVTMILAAVVAGVASHILVFIHGEWHLQGASIIRFYLVASATVVILDITYGNAGLASGIARGLSTLTIYCVSLYGSIVIYRVFFHPLRKFSGPSLAKLSKLWHTYHTISSKNHLLLDSLYNQYGKFVRTGPSEITIFSPEAFVAMNGPSSSCSKAVWYDFLLPEIAVNTTRHKASHDQRRRIWDRGFSNNALRLYNQQISEFIQQLEMHIEKLSAERRPVVVSDWFYWLSFDIMGKFAFGRSFRMLENEEWHSAIRMLRSAMRLLGPLSSVPWLAQIGFAILPRVSVVGDWYAMMDFCKDRMRERIEMHGDQSDVSSWLIDASRKANSIEADRHWLNGDAIAIIIAGSDTVAPTLVYLFYELARRPSEALKLLLELQFVDISDHNRLQALPHLNGVINETLRLHPPVPTGGYRQSPPEGIWIDGHFVPGGTTLVAPRYTIGRLEDCFQEAQEFIPERWYSKPEMVKDKRAFQPFSHGRYGCVGKNLALSELRSVVGSLVTKFDVCFAPGEDGSRVEREMKDQFTAAPGRLELIFRKRS